MFRGTTHRSSAWRFGFVSPDYMLLSLLWTYGPLATTFDYDIVIGLVFESRDAVLNFAYSMRQGNHDQHDFIARHGHLRLVDDVVVVRRQIEAVPPWARIKAYLRQWHTVS